MNLLESLALRMLDSPPVIAPRRIPYQQILPADPQPAAPMEDDAAWARPQATPRPAAKPGPVTAPQAASAQAAVPAQADAPPAGHGRDRVLPTPGRPVDPPPPRTVVFDGGADRGPQVHGPLAGDGAAVSPATRETPPPPGLRVLLREERHVEHHHHLVAGPAPVQPAPPAQPAAAGAPAAAPPRAAEPRPPVRAAPVPQPVQAAAPPMVQPRPQPPVERARPGPVDPPASVVHVEIGRITVRMQAPPAGPGTETTRPAAPSLGLEAYSAARRTRGR